VFYAVAVMYADESMSNQRLTVKQAAERLNTTEAAIRQRIQRDSIAYEKDEETNRVYILLEDTDERLDDVEPDTEHRIERELVDTLQEQLRLEREASAELRRIIAGLTARIPAIDPPPEQREAPVNAGGGAGEGGDAAPKQEKPRSWLSRFFGL
jgi:hypothetical protein